MKKSLLALAVLGAFAGTAFAQSNVSIYGIADAGIARVDNGARTAIKQDSGLQSGSRIGFKGVEDLGGGLSAIFTLENGYGIDDGTLGQSGRLFGRQAFVGLNGNFGAIKLGRQYNPIRTTLESVDPFGFGLAGNIANVFNPYGERADNTVNYSLPTNLGGIYGQAAYSFGEIPGSNSTGRQIGFNLGYANGPINAVIAYHDQNLVSGTADNGKAKTTLLGGTYDFGVVKAHAAYAWNKGDNATGARNVDSRDLMIGATVPVGAASQILASYIRRSDKLVADRDATQWAIGYTYSLSKRTNLYTSYARVSNEGASTLGGAAAAGLDPSTFSLGIRHKF